MLKKILVTGGAGFIGSHTVVALVEAGYEPVILDNFSNSEKFILDRINKLTGKKVKHYEADYQDTKTLASIIKKEKIIGIIHFAAYKFVGVSVEKPLVYYANNVSGFIELLNTVSTAGIKSFIFSSSAAVYGTPDTAKVSEETACHPASPYGWSKLFDEIILRDQCTAMPELNGIALRYFNVVGAHSSGIIGELFSGKPQNLLPIILDAINNKTSMTIFGNDYKTKDGTCLRDYIHVMDLAEAHVKALDLSLKLNGGYKVYNIGTGRPTSVLEFIKAFEKNTGVKVPYKIGGRRAGDPTAYYALNNKAVKELGWEAKRTVNDAVKDAWTWKESL